jgi:hypothetical protein
MALADMAEDAGISPSGTKRTYWGRLTISAPVGKADVPREPGTSVLDPQADSSLWPGHRSAPIYRTGGDRPVGQLAPRDRRRSARSVAPDAMTLARTVTPRRSRAFTSAWCCTSRSIISVPCVNAPCRRCSGVPPSSSLAFARPGSCASSVRSRSGRSQPTASWIPARSIRRSTLPLCLKWQVQPIGVLWYTSSRMAGSAPRSSKKRIAVSICERVKRPSAVATRCNLHV